MRKTRTFLRQNAIALLALAISLSGTAYAAATIGTAQLKNGAVTTPKLADNAVTSPKIKNATVANSDMALNTRTYWALINASGSVEKSSGGVTVAYGDNGTGNPQYRVRFPEPVGNCGYSATASNPVAVSTAEWVLPRVMTATLSTSSNRTVAVQNNLQNVDVNDNWFLSQGDFMLVVVC